MLEDIAYVLENGIKVAMVYGDRDFACNWIGGERSSLSIPYIYSEQFKQAGYAPIEVGENYEGGQVRQYGNLSFSRVYQAGHMGKQKWFLYRVPGLLTLVMLVPSYQPETAYRIFMRALLNKDIASGSVQVLDDYATAGPSSTWHIKNEVLPAPPPLCYILDPGSCPDEQYELVKNNTAIVKDFIVVGTVVSEPSNLPSTQLGYSADNQMPLGDLPYEL